MRRPLLLPSALVVASSLACRCAGVNEVHDERLLAETTFETHTAKLLCRVGSTVAKDAPIATGCDWWTGVTIAGVEEPVLLASGPGHQDCDDARDVCESMSGSIAGANHEGWRTVTAVVGTEPYVVMAPAIGRPFLVPDARLADVAAMLAAAPTLEEARRARLARVKDLSSYNPSADPVWDGLKEPEALRPLVGDVLPHVPTCVAPLNVVEALAKVKPEEGRTIFEAARTCVNYRELVPELPEVDAWVLDALSHDPPTPEGYLPDRRADPWLASIAVERKLVAAAPLLEARLPPTDQGSTIDDPNLAAWVQLAGAIDALDPARGDALLLGALAAATGPAYTNCEPLSSLAYDGYPPAFARAVAARIAPRDTPERRRRLVEIGRGAGVSDAARHAALWVLRTWGDTSEVPGVSLTQCQGTG